MTEQELREKARKEVLLPLTARPYTYEIVNVLLRWRAEGQAAEREACAALETTLVRRVDLDMANVTHVYDVAYNRALVDYAAAIRARGRRGE